MESPDLARMRESYARDGLAETAAGDDPLNLFGRWFDDALAAQIHEPNAMALATSTSDGHPSVRIVLLKGVDESGLTFFTNYESRKGRELESNPRAAAAMLWHPLQRQVRVEGTVSRIAAADSERYFHSRPRGSQLSAAASPQSSVVEDRAALEALYADVAETYGAGEVTRPDHWGGYRIEIESIEFWQGREDRLHDRLLYLRAGTSWSRTRLAP
ncbi:pyridoxamine 5'-phosphate oxidase [Aeromicrobium panaciterrae]|uniref:Pyridoxine/pyridoxamine 5'-phosphate oxidase n=1 Tax=Aeromicrobium panaciterrae TaxID=363861 RepID=A0ABU1ULL4_9ACTN|nr:pyridoxamine 5'-phosphate oxidase [Aeromicrobium panaciterrae]MDR7086029.1 pyridoxamine 5'-phosphate oxidase [Aeromicrobium panaciterrae]